MDRLNEIRKQYEEANKHMEYHEDKQKMFDPLIRNLNAYNVKDEKFNNTLSSYMYMGHNGQSRIYHYKHRDSREYVYLHENGEVVEGEVEISEW